LPWGIVITSDIPLLTAYWKEGEAPMLRYGNLGMILLAVFLIIFGLITLGVDVGVLRIIMALCALAAGVLLLLNRA
jgi:hypothetical protein